MKKRTGKTVRHPLRVFVLDCEALSLAVRGDRTMIAWLDLAARGEAEVVTSPMTLVEAYDGRTTEQRWDWVLSRLQVADIGKDEARQARRLLADAKLHGHKYAIDAVLAVIALAAERTGHRLHLGRRRPGEARPGHDRRQEGVTDPSRSRFWSPFEPVRPRAGDVRVTARSQVRTYPTPGGPAGGELESVLGATPHEVESRILRPASPG